MRRGHISPRPRRLLLAALLLVPSACATVHPYYDYASEPDPRKQEFLLGPADVVRINVWKNTDLSVDATVRPDGRISMPLLGEIPAGGRTLAQLRSEIAQRLTTFVKDESATVTVTVQNINSYHFLVSGNVEHAGEFTSTHYVTVREALALAGGPNRFGSADQAVIIRVDPKRGTKRIPIDYTAILDGTHPEQDLPIVAGDLIYVP
ncbi:MAG TPA: polysaccharide biosynthesis/export family protein [Polyangia bacterium]|jgi:polysaccharide export outer membrane protein|nr:polysaccharide biosynthesis/export family protein [Polyangia bacterium]